MRQSLLGASLCVLLVAVLWWRSPAEPTQSKREIFALGTLIQFTIENSPAGAAASHAAINAAAQALQNFDQRWSPDGTGALGLLNQRLRSASDATVAIELLPDILRAVELCRSSGGLFDPGIGRLVVAWGFDDEQNFRSEPPAESLLANARAACPSLCLARVDGQHLRLDSPGARLDFGASAKGRAVGQAIAIMRAAGIANAIVNAGGDLQAIGRASGRAWRVGIRDPRADGEQAIVAALNLADGEAVFTSGDYERYFEYAGQRYHHIIDPRTGAPAVDARSATVVHTDPMLADAASTALFVAGPKQAAAVMQALGVELYLLIAADGARLVSPALQARIEWLDDPR